MDTLNCMHVYVHTGTQLCMNDGAREDTHITEIEVLLGSTADLQIQIQHMQPHVCDVF